MIDERSLDTLFRNALTQYGWLDQPVSDDELRQVWDLAKMPPTSMNCLPARFVFVRSAAAKERLRPALAPGNVERAMAAPVVTIVAWDTRFHEHLPTLFPQNPGAMARFEGDPAIREATGFRSGTLQGAYLILAARAAGLDCGPMSGFDNAKVDAEFFPDGRLRSNFLCCIGHGDPAKRRPRNPRLSFDEACQLL